MVRNILESDERLDAITYGTVTDLGLPHSPELSSVERALIDYLAQNGPASASSEEFVRHASVSRSRIAQLLNGLRGRGLVQARKDGRKMKYFVEQKGQAAKGRQGSPRS